MAERLTRRAIPSLGKKEPDGAWSGSIAPTLRPSGGLHVQEDAGEPHLERAPTQNSTVVDTWNCRGSPIATYSRLALDG